MGEAAVTNDIRQEANSALMEVDKGLRSSAVGEQCEAIVKCPVLMDKFPFPVMTSTALLKLADVFSAQATANLLRLHILKVFQLAHKHLGKVSSPEELVRRLSLVTHSNDPVARALALRVFGCIASIVAERKNVHHSIHHGLDSHHQVEVEAAIFATSCLVRHSATFAAGVCEKISSTVQGQAVPVEMKLRLVPILSEMHHNLATANQVRELCVKLLPTYPAFSLVTSTLHTLTTLAMATKIHIPDQVWLLLSYARSDARGRVRLFALRELESLAAASPHMWSCDMVQAVEECVSEAVSEREQQKGLRTLLRLSRSLAVQHMTSLPDAIGSLQYSTHTNTAALVLVTITNIAMATANGVSSSSHVTELTDQVIEALLVGDFSSEANSLGLSCLLCALMQLSSVSGSASKAALDTLLSFLPQCSGRQLKMVCDCLVLVGATAKTSWSEVASYLTHYLTHHPDQRPHLLLPFSAVLQEVHRGEWSSPQRQSFISSVLPSLLEQVWALHSPHALWLAYRLARRASAKGYHELAGPVYQRLSQSVTLARFRRWLSALHHFSSSQLLLSPSPPSSHLIPALGNAAALVSKAAMLIKASCPPSSFPLRYLTSLSSLMRAHHQLLTSCVSASLLPSSPSSVSQKFQFCVSRFTSLAEELSGLHSSLFDADSYTLSHISLLRQSCLLMVNIIASLVLSRKPLVTPGKVGTPMSSSAAATPTVSHLSHFSSGEVLAQTCRALLDHTQSLAPSLQSQPVGEEHARVLGECSQKLLQVPLKLPPYFFTSSQNTSVQLAFSPPLPPPGQAVEVPLHSHLSLKVEGVVQHSGKKGESSNVRSSSPRSPTPPVHRTPTAVCVRVKITLDKSFSSEHKVSSMYICRGRGGGMAKLCTLLRLMICSAIFCSVYNYIPFLMFPCACSDFCLPPISAPVNFCLVHFLGRRAAQPGEGGACCQ
jgi:integrator complex subunit 7